MKNLITILTIFLISLCILPLGAEESTSFDHTISFGLTEGITLDYSSSLTSEEPDLFNHLNWFHDLTASLDIPFSFYTFSGRFGNIFLTDFAKTNHFNYIENQDILNNSTTLSLGNQFFFKNMFYFNLDLDLLLALPFNEDNPLNTYNSEHTAYLDFNPTLKLGGNYFFGLDWELIQIFTFHNYLGLTESSFSPSTALTLTYELFRFFGPRDITVGITATNTVFLSFALPGAPTLNSVSEDITAGLYLLYSDFKPWANFVYSLAIDAQTGWATSQQFGFELGAQYTISNFTFVIKYKGLDTFKDVEDKGGIGLFIHYWDSVVETSVAFQFKK